MKTILVTGGCGFIGSHLSLFLKKKKYNVIVIDSLIIGKKNYLKEINFLKLTLQIKIN